MTDSKRIRKVEEIYHSALEFPIEKRESFLKEICGDDEDLRLEVESLLSFQKKSGDFLSTPPKSLIVEMFSKEESPDLTGTQINQYRIISKLGKGGMGEIFLAKDTKLDRRIALKILPQAFAKDSGRMGRFVREAKSASALNHPNIITIYEIGEADDFHYIATEFIDGKTLGDYARSNILNLPAVLDIAIQIASALDEAHMAGIVHRDIKPENVMVRPNGLVKILDFGIAKLSEGLVRTNSNSPGEEDRTLLSLTAATDSTIPGMIIGTPNYMSPEQARGKPIDHQTDIFSFGILFYELLSGKLPFEGESAMDTIGAILHLEPKPINQLLPDLSPDIEQIVTRTLRKDLSERYQSIKDLLSDLREARVRIGYETAGQTIPPDSNQSASQQNKAEFPDEPLSTENAPVKSASQSGAGNADIKSAESVEAASGAEQNATVDSPEQNTISSPDDPRIAPVSPVNGLFSFARSKNVYLAAAVILVLATVGFFGYRYLTVNNQIKSIAVMPFVNESGNADIAYISDGISEGLINNLSQSNGVKVIARSSSFKFKNKAIDPKEIGIALGVDAILTGRILQNNGELVISVALVNTLDNTEIWGTRYKRSMSDLLITQNEISREITERLNFKLTDAGQKEITKKVVASPDAYALLLKGRFASRKFTPESLKEAAAFYEEAIRIQPDYALAFAEVATVYRLLGVLSVYDPKEMIPKAETATLRAQELDDEIAEPHSSLASIKRDRWDWQGAEIEYRKALSIKPNFAEAHEGYGIYLSIMGKHELALNEVQRARDLDPLRLLTNLSLGAVHYNARDYDKAIEIFKQSLELEANAPAAYAWLGIAYGAKGSYQEAIDAYKNAIKFGDDTVSTQCYFGYTLALSGNIAEAKRIRRRMETGKQYVPPVPLAILYTGLGDKEAALKTLEHALAIRDPQLQYLNAEPHLDRIKAEPRFQKVVRSVGL